MKKILIIFFLVVSFSTFGQQTGIVTIKTSLWDSDAKKRILRVDKGTELEITGKMEKGYYPVIYDGNKYRVFHRYVYIEKKADVAVGEIKVPSQITELTDFDQEKINQSLLFTNYCLDRYRKGQLTGFTLSVIGGSLAVIGALNEPSELVAIGGIVSLSGVVVQLRSYRWLKKAYVFPIENGAAVGIQINF